MTPKRLWKICSSNARAAIKVRGIQPQKIFPFCPLTEVSYHKMADQQWFNDYAHFALVFYGGIWETNT